MDAITITPDSTFDEFTRSTSMPFKPTAVRFAIQIASALFGMTMVVTIIETWGTFAGAASIVAGLSVAAIFIFSRIMINSRLRGCYLAGKDDPAVYTFDQGGVVGTCDCTKTEFSWKAFDRLLDAETMYVLVTKSLACIRIPKRNIPADRAAEFSALLSEKVGTSRVIQAK